VRLAGTFANNRNTWKNEDRAGWLVVLAAFLGVMVSFGSVVVFTFSVFLKPLSSEFGWSREGISRAFGIAAITIAICSPWLGHLLDRFGPRKVILPCMAVYGCALTSLALLTPHLSHFYLVFVVIGIVGNGTTQMGYARAVSSWFDRRRGVALALVMAGTGVGSMILPPFAQMIISTYGWRTAYIVLGFSVFVFGLPLTAAFVREKPGHRSQTAHPEDTGSTVKRSLRTRAFWILVAALFLSSISINGTLTHFSALLTDRHISIQVAAFCLSVLGGFSLCGRLITGYLLDKFFGPYVAFCLFTAAAVGILIVASAASPYSAYAAAGLIGVGLGAEADITPYLLTRYFGLASFSTIYGFTWTAYAIAGAIGPVLMGRAFDLTGSYISLVTLLAGATFIAAVLMLLMPRYGPLSKVTNQFQAAPDLARSSSD
jgi:predicted MFS family arabinose efflux permease